MKAISAEALAKAAGCTLSVAEVSLPGLLIAQQIADLSTTRRIAYFVANAAIESGNLRATTENLNYSAKGLLKTWPKLFTAASAARFAHRPEAIANHVYGGRNGNGKDETGDGWRFRGRSFTQVTFRANYVAFDAWTKARGVKVDFVSRPDALSAPEYAWLGPAWFWVAHKTNQWADKDDPTAARKSVNGGLIGLDKFVTQVARAKRAFA